MQSEPLEVLLVEDSPADADLMREVVEQASFPIHIQDVSDGVQAMDYLRRNAPYESVIQPDVVLLDLNLPKKDGRVVLQEIKEDLNLKDIPVVVLTTSRADEDTVYCYKLGASSYLIKPATLDEYEQVEDALKGFWLTLGARAKPPGLVVDKKKQVLLIEDNPADADYLVELLNVGDECPFDVTSQRTLVSGLVSLKEEEIDLVLLDLSLPESQGLDTFMRVRDEASEVPVIILTGLEDHVTALEAVGKGAQDYLVKGNVNGEVLIKSMEHAIERHRLLVKMVELRERLLDGERKKVLVEVAGAAAHEMNQPLAALQGLTEFLMQKDIPNDIEENIKTIHEATLKLSEIVKKIESTYKYVIKPYFKEVNIIDFDASSGL